MIDRLEELQKLGTKFNYYSKKMRRYQDLTPDELEDFLEVVEKTGNLAYAAVMASAIAQHFIAKHKMKSRYKFFLEDSVNDIFRDNVDEHGPFYSKA
ncbi:hypothetical protein [Bacillus smithii]|uniref:hypothetical protein n=1 Tax=Bacillus smithii TaxID=1479 RepID=UPI0022E0E3B0|nr:hypothetical protein [Bacillus smithii]